MIIFKIKLAYRVFVPVYNSLTIAILLSLMFFLPVKADGMPTILAFGDSLTAGYGLEAGYAFPAKLEATLHQKNIAAKVINGGLSGDTTAGGLARLDWMMADNPDLVIIELGANDGLRGLDPDSTRDNLSAIIRQLKKRHVNILLTGMLSPPNLGVEYAKKYNAIFPELAKEFNVAFYPFFLKGVVNDPSLNQGDGVHPNAKGVDIIVANIVPFVIKALNGEHGP